MQHYPFREGLGSDNHAGVHPEILAALVSVNISHAPSYGIDPVSETCEHIFKKTFGPNASSFLMFNGTAANVACLKALLKSFEAVVCSPHSHLHTSECGAPETHLGSKLLLAPSRDGKIRPEDIEPFLVQRGDQHAVQARVVSITQPTELGVCYTLEELRELREFTTKHNLKLHMDGARLANAAYFLKCSLKELTADIKLDALSFGGTKNGLLGVEAVIFWDQSLAQDFRYYRKQLMQLPSKTRFLSIQFKTYLESDLWHRISKHSHQMALYLEQGLRKIPSLKILFPVESNGVFVKMPRSWIKPLKSEMFFYVWDEHEGSCRLMTSFDTTEESLNRFIHKALSLEEKKT